MYNIDFGAVAFANLLIIYIFYNRKYGRISPMNKRYEAVVLWSMIAAGLDVLTAIMIDYAAQIPMWINMLANSLCQISLTAIGVSFIRYIYSYCGMLEKRKKVLRVLDGVMVLYVITCLLNYFTHMYFWFDEENRYVHGPLYIVMYLMPLLCGVAALLIVMLYKKPFGWKAKLVSIGISAMVIGFAACQFLLWPDTLLTLYGISVSMLTIMFLVETPNYHTIIETMDEMEKERIRANAANEAKSAFLARMSHEIRTPLSVVIGMNEIIMRETTEKNVFECAADAKASASTLQHIINDILDMSRIESGKLEIVPTDYDLASVIYDLMTITYERAKEKNLKIEVHVDKELPSKLHGDDMRIRQVLTNLLSNAVKYTEQGIITLSVSGTKQDGKVNLHFAVKDTGIGIRKEDIERLFEAFTRVDEERNHSIEGTGLGLSITKQLLELMGSELKVESEYGKGSVFSFDLVQEIIEDIPIGDRKWHRRDAASYSYKVSFVAPDVKLLVVDDNALNRKVVRNLLRPTLVQLEEAGDGFECLEKIKETKYDLILLDHLMPIMDGVETLKKMKSQCPNMSRGCPVVALTANAFVGAREKYVAEGFRDFVSKPINPVLLEDMLLQLLPEDKILRPEDSSAVNEEEIKKKQEAMIASLLEELPQIDGVNWEIGKEHFNSTMDLKETMIEFYSTMDETIKELEKLARIDIHGYRIKVHALKSSAAMVGMLPISELAAMLEDAAKSEMQAKIDKWNPLLMEELRMMKKRLAVLVLDEPEQATAPDGEEGSMPETRILIIDDSAMMLRSIKKMIETDYKVMLTTSGKQALRYLEEKELPDLIILDYEMPEMNGTEVFARIKENPAWSTVPVLFLTGVTDEEHIASIMSMEPEGYLLKPPSEKTLKEKIAELLVK